MIKKNEKEPTHRINEKIKAREVMLVGDNVTRDIYHYSKALQMAEDMGLDLVEMSLNNAGIPICKIMDYSKFLYDQKKNQKKTDKVITKEIRFKPFIGDADFGRKIEQAMEFLKKGFKVKLDCLFTGRGWENKKDNILRLTYTLLDDVSEIGTPEQLPKILGNKMICIIKPKKK